MKPTDLSKSLTDFLSRYLPGERGMSYNTISSYKVTFILFFTFMKEQKGINLNNMTLKDLTQEDIVSFLDWLQRVRKCSDATRNVRLAALHSFCRFLEYQKPELLYELQRVLSISMKKTEKGSVSHLTIEGIKLLLRQPNTKTPKGLRDLAILCLMYDTAARVSEVINLTPSMIRLEQPYTIKLVGKGNKARIVPLMESDVIILRQYMIKNRLLEDSANQKPLFYNARKEKLTRSGLHHIFRYYACEARKKASDLIPDKKLSCHSLRHSKAVHLLQAGVNLVYIRDILGHQSVKTTEIYARTDSKQKREVLEKAYSDVITQQVPTWEHNKSLLDWLKEFK